MRCALIDTSSNIVVNLIMADPSVDSAPEGFSLHALPDDSPVSIGWLWDGVTFTDPSPSPEPL